MKKFIVLLLVVCMCVPVFSSCTTLHGEDDKGANISVFLSSFPQTLDPAAVQLDADSAMLFGMIFQPLTTINEKGEVKGALAKNWYHKYDKQDLVHKMYFELNTTYWSDGILVQAQHVADAWTRILSPEFESPYASLLFPIKNAMAYKAGIMTESDLKVYAEGDDLLCIEFEEEYDINLFAEAVSCIALTPIRVEIIERSLKNNPKDDKSYDRLQDWDKNAALIVTNGAYKVQGYEEGTKLVLERNRYYYRNDDEDMLDKSVKPYRLTCIYQETTLSGNKSIDDAAKLNEYQFQYNKYQDGHNYLMSAFNAETYGKLSNQLKTQKLLSTYTYFFNCREGKVTANALVRQALSASLDREKMASAVGTGEIASKGFVPNGVFDNKAGTDFRNAGGDIYNTKADSGKAQSLLKQANVKGGKLKLVYIIPWTSQLYTLDTLHKSESKLVNTYNPYEIVAKAAKEAWEALGFEVELKGIYADEYQETISSGNWDIIGVDYSMNSVDALSYLAPFATKCSGNLVSISLDSPGYTPHYTGIEDDSYDELIYSIIYDSNRETRTVKLHAAEAKLAELCPATALFQYQRSYVISGNLKNISDKNWFGFLDLSDLRLDNYIDVNSRENEESFAKAEAAGEKD